MYFLRFAVTAPWGIELEENIMVIVHNNVLVIVGYNNLHWAFLLLGNRLGLDAWVNLAVNEVLDEFADVIVGDLHVLVERKLLVLDGLLNGKRGPLVDFEVQITSVCAE